MRDVNFDEIFAPVTKFNTTRVIYAFWTAIHLEMFHLDVKPSFLNKELDVEIYMEQLEGFEQKGLEHLVCKLKKSLYGSMQFERAWNECIHLFFVNKWFIKIHLDHLLYVLQNLAVNYNYNHICKQPHHFDQQFGYDQQVEV